MVKTLSNQQKPKIVHLMLGKCNPNRLNGVNRAVHQYAEAGLNFGMDVEVWGITKDPHSPTPSRSYSLRLFQRTISRFFIDSNLKKMLSELKARVDVVHLHGAFTPEFWAISNYLKTLGLWYVISPHGVYSSGAMNARYLKKKLYFHLFERSIISGAGAIHILTQAEVSGISLSKLNHDKLCIIPNGQDLKPSYSRSKSSLEFVFCGRLKSDHKGLDLLISGFSLYKKQGGIGFLSLVGDGPDKCFLMQLVSREKLNNFVTWHGPKYGKEKDALVSNADFFILTSRWEGLPMAALEAAAAAVPLLVTKETNLQSYILAFNSGIIIKNNTPDGILEGLQCAELAWQSGDIEKYAETAKKMVKTQFSWNIIFQKMKNELYGF